MTKPIGRTKSTQIMTEYHALLGIMTRKSALWAIKKTYNISERSFYNLLKEHRGKT